MESNEKVFTFTQVRVGLWKVECEYRHYTFETNKYGQWEIEMSNKTSPEVIWKIPRQFDDFASCLEWLDFFE